MLVLSRGPEEAIMIGGQVEVRVLDVRGDRVRLGILAPAEVAIHRKEVFLSIQKEMRAAAASDTSGLDRALNILEGRTMDKGKDPEGGKENGVKGQQ